MPSNGQSQYKRKNNAKRRWPSLSIPQVICLLVLAVGYIIFIVAGGDEYFTISALRLHGQRLTEYIDEHAVKMALSFIFIYAGVVTFSLPGALFLTVATGFFFGGLVATTIVVIGATIGATTIFIIAKTTFGEPLRARSAPALLRMENGFAKNAFNYLLILRLIPLFPFFLVNIVPAFLGVRLRDYILATFFGIIPGTFVFAQIGAGLDSIIDSDQELSLQSLVSWEILSALIGLAFLSALPLLYKFWKTRSQVKVELHEDGDKV